MDINKAGIDIIFGAIGIALLSVISFLTLIFGRAKRMFSLRVFVLFSLASSTFLFFLLYTDNKLEFSRAYFLIQSFSYLLEMAMCIELAEMIIKNNWIVLLIFGPLLTAVMVLFVVKYSVPTSLNDVLYPGYAATTLCGFVLFVAWLLETRLEGRLDKPYSGIAASIGIYISFRFLIMLANNYYKMAHWNVIGRLHPINELVFTCTLLYSILPPSNIIPFPLKMTIRDMAAICRTCGMEFPNHKPDCKFKASPSVLAFSAKKFPNA